MLLPEALSSASFLGDHQVDNLLPISIMIPAAAGRAGNTYSDDCAYDFGFFVIRLFWTALGSAMTRWGISECRDCRCRRHGEMAGRIEGQILVTI